MHDDLKTLLRAGWSFGLRLDGERFAAIGKREAETVRASAIEPLEALARVIYEIHVEAAK